MTDPYNRPWIPRDLPYEWDFDALECAAIEAAPAPAHQCKNCGLAPSFEGSDDCVACTAAYFITDPDQLVAARRTFASTPWIRTLNAEIDRQLGALIVCGRVAA